MSEDWYYLNEKGDKIGPFTLEELNQKNKFSKEIDRNTKVISSDTEDWIEFDVINRLYSQQLNNNQKDNIYKSNKDFRFYTVGGWLLFFLITLVVVRPLMVIISYLIISAESYIPSDIKLFNTVDIILQIIITLFSLYTGFQLFFLKTNAVRIAKLFLIVNLILSAIYLAIPYLLGISDLYTDELFELNMKSFVGTALYFSIWYSYLIKSVRVKLTYITND